MPAEEVVDPQTALITRIEECLPVDKDPTSIREGKKTLLRDILKQILTSNFDTCDERMRRELYDHLRKVVVDTFRLKTTTHMRDIDANIYHLYLMAIIKIHTNENGERMWEGSRCGL